MGGKRDKAKPTQVNQNPYASPKSLTRRPKKIVGRVQTAQINSSRIQTFVFLEKRARNTRLPLDGGGDLSRPEGR
jgi:hypothetical protein